jgi:nitroimidazol reductase NimA-like FMN-containing flavoprotein (pyridoxamine 5'-phosphate oxidase superfamily)
MQRKLTSVRDMTVVEKELSQSEFGVIALSIVKEKSFVQFATNFVYQDKNIYIFIDDKELLRNIRFDSLSRFTILKNKKISKTSESVNPLYQLFSVTITGKIREVEEKKTVKDITQSFVQKYSGKLMLSGQIPELKGKLLFIDTEEFLAFDEIGF